MNEVVFCLSRLFSLAWSLDRRRFVAGAGLLLAGAVATPVIGLASGRLVDAVHASAGDAAGHAVGWGLVLAIALVGELMLGHFAHLYYFELAELTEERFNRDLLQIVNGSPYLDQTDDPAFADRVDLLRQDVMQMRTTVQFGLQLGATAVQILLTAVLLVTLSPWLLLLLAAAAVPVVVGKRAEARFQATREEQATTTRGIRHLRRLATSPASQKEIRLSGGGGYLLGRQRTLLEAYGTAMARADRRYALLRGAGQLAFGVAYVGAVVWAFELARQGRASAGDVVLIVVLATQLSGQMANGVELLGSVHRAAAGLRRFIALRAEQDAHADGRQGIALDGERGRGLRLEALRFRYPGAQADVLCGIDLELPGGASVAVVGENGAGKSTLLKLLTGLYRPTAGRILVDGADLAGLSPDAWRQRTAALFQDFARVELALRDSVGIGDLTHVDQDAGVRGALVRARADELGETIGLDAVIGSGYADGRDLSGGQWQTVGFARTLMRTTPLLLVLDEPASALDALAEQRLVDAYQETAREVAATVGGVTVFVTHRLSTVRLADHIVVLDAGTVAEQGTHEELLAAGGRYAQLWAMQARAYS
ncbi:ABC transporter ATP-binding protein [Xylanimonas sp. McL0601]|uniref:ABC transporter ATP-binding protein n=1 Tax=Xylanimonas sp. McL0601 TaxID=3414739 RepID=UPI003CE6B3E5